MVSQFLGLRLFVRIFVGEVTSAASSAVESPSVGEVTSASERESILNSEERIKCNSEPSKQSQKLFTLSRKPSFKPHLINQLNKLSNLYVTAGAPRIIIPTKYLKRSYQTHYPV